MTTTLTSQTEFQVNTTSAHDQAASTVAVLADGSYVVAWQSFNPGMTSDFRNPLGWDVLWQRYAADGTPIGSESGFAGVFNDQVQPVIAALSNGGYAIAFASALDYDGRYRTYDFGIQAAAYDADGVLVEGSAQSTNGRIGNQDSPAIAGVAGGQFVLGWQTDGGEDPPWTLPGVVGPTANANQGTDLVAAGLTDGGYVMAWTTAGTVYAQRFPAPGAGAGDAAPPVAVGSGGATPAVATLQDGSFVVTWQGTDRDGSGILVQRFAADGDAMGVATRVNSTTAGEQSAPSAVSLGDGGFAVAWVSSDGDGGGVYVQRFDAQGEWVGTQTRVNAVTVGDQVDASLAATADGGFIATWTSSGQDGSGLGIFAREFDLTEAVVVPESPTPVPAMPPELPATGYMALPAQSHAAQAYRLYKAAFDRTPDAPGLAYQTAALDSGLALAQVASHFIASPEFQTTYGPLDDARFVTELYDNILHRAPDAGGLAFHVSHLQAGAPRADVLVGFSESPENQAALIGISQGLSG